MSVPQGRVVGLRLKGLKGKWGRLDAEFGLPPVDGLLAATALVHDLVLVTRNTKDVLRTGTKLLNPFAPSKQ